MFHEIDFSVNEGYRRIPHGGIEIGGVLFGRIENESVRIEAFRPIECEHASGPSFLLSEHDVAKLREQLTASASDPKLQGLEPVGWFIAHTRSALEMNDHEAALFHEFFPGQGNIMLLVKPERFQPTRFAFLVRGKDGRLEGDLPNQASILPLPARKPRDQASDATTVPPKPSVLPVREPAPQPEPTRELAAPAPAIPSPAAEPNSLPPPDEIKPPPEPQFDSGAFLRDRNQPERSRFRVRVALSLGAGALGAAVGYLMYLQLPSPIIPLRIEPRQGAFVLSWPAAQTDHAGYAAMRIDDGEPVALSAEDKAEGKAAIKALTDNMKIELIAQHWFRDSRGIIRYIRAQKTTGSSP